MNVQTHTGNWLARGAVVCFSLSMLAGASAEPSDKWKSMLDASAVALQRGRYAEAIEAANEAVRMEPKRWEGHFLKFIVSATSARWTSASRSLVEAIDAGFAPDNDTKAAPCLLLLEQVVCLDGASPDVTAMLKRLDQLAAEGKIESKAILNSLTTRARKRATEEAIVSRMAATDVRRQGKVLMIAKVEPFVRAWGNSDFSGSPLTASLLRKFATQGISVVAVPKDEDAWTLESRLAEIRAWENGGNDSTWQLAWVSDLAAEKDPEGQALLNEAGLRWKQAQKGRATSPTVNALLGTVSDTAADEAIALSAPANLLDRWKIKRRDTLRSTITAGLKVAPSSQTLWGALVRHGWSVAETQLPGHHLSYCVQTAIYIATDFRAPEAYGAALLALQDRLPELSAEDRTWVKNGLTPHSSQR